MARAGIGGTAVAVAMAAVALGGLVLPSAAAAAASTNGAPPVVKGTYARIAVPGAATTMPEYITDSGVIIGCFQRKTGPLRGFIDRHGTFVTITDPAAGTSAGGLTCPLGANDAGVLVGTYRGGSGGEHGFVYRNGRFTTIDEPHAGRRTSEGTVALGINKAGVIVGFYLTRKHQEKGFILKSGQFTTVVNPKAALSSGGTGTALNGIADNGTSSGLYADGTGNLHGFLYRQGTFRQIDVPGALNTEVACISPRGGLVVGSYQARSGSRLRGFTDRHGTFRTMPVPTARLDTLPNCGNDLSRVVGLFVSQQSRVRGFRFTPGRLAAAAQHWQIGPRLTLQPSPLRLRLGLGLGLP